MANYLRGVINVKETPQSQPIPGSQQVQNSAGGYSFAVDNWVRLERFLILGSEGGSYYATERKLTEENIGAVKNCIAQDGVRVVRALTEISDSGRAPKNDPALFVLALCASASGVATRRAALDVLPRVARIGTHLFHFAEYVDKMRGWGPALKKAVAGWYTEQSVDQLAYQLVKYQQRDGWSHRDLLRLSHPRIHGPYNDLFHYVTKGEWPGHSVRPGVLAGFEDAKTTSEPQLIQLIQDHNLTREMIPTEHQKSPAVWEALLENMPMTAMIRTLGRMGAVGLLKPMSAAVKTVCSRLRNEDLLKKARVHPIQVLIALKTYEQGHGDRGKLSWTPVPQVITALNEAFHLAFKNIEPTGKRWLLGLDVSGSMCAGAVAGMQSMTPNIAAAAMALVTAKTEEQYYICGFADSFRKLPITAQDNLTDAMRKTGDLSFGRTDCSLPMTWALENKVEVDVFAIYTDNETWFGRIHSVQALKQYRDRMGIPAKLIVVGMVSNGFTIADPDDAGMLDVVGFDAAAPAVMADFARR